MMLATTRAINRSSGHLYTFREGAKEYGPYPGATAICGLQDSLGGSNGLMNWGVGLALDRANELLSSPVPIEWDAVRAAAFAAKDEPMNLGTAVHAAVDRFNRCEPLNVDAKSAPYVAHYGAAIFQKGIRILGSERFVVNTDIGFGGTYDSLVEIDGERGPLDVKTGKEKPSQRLQLTGLSMGQYHGEAGMEAEPMPELSGVGFILLLRADGYRLVRHEITDRDREHFARLVAMYHHIREWSASFQPTAVTEAA